MAAQKTGTGPIGVLGYRIFGLPVDREVIFSNHKKVYKKKIENRQRKLIIKLPFLKPFFDVTEKILLVTTGYSPTTTIDRLLIGWFFVYLKRSLFWKKPGKSLRASMNSTMRLSTTASNSCIQRRAGSVILSGHFRCWRYLFHASAFSVWHLLW